MRPTINDLERLASPALPRKALVFAPPKNSQQIEALEHLAGLTPEERTVWEGNRYAEWMNEQYKELARVAG